MNKKGREIAGLIKTSSTRFSDMVRISHLVQLGNSLKGSYDPTKEL